MRCEIDPAAGEHFRPTEDPMAFDRYPRRLTFSIDDGSLDWDVTATVVDGESNAHEVESVTITRRAGGPPVTAVGLKRIPLASLAIDALRMTSERWTVEVVDGRPSIVPPTVPYEQFEAAFFTDGDHPAAPPRPSEERLRRAIKRKGFTTQRSDTPDPAKIAEVVAVHADARHRRIKDPARYTADRTGLSRSSVYNYLKLAKEATS